MAFSLLSGDEQRSMFLRLYDAIAPRVAVAFSSVNRELRASTQVQRQQLRADHEAAVQKLCYKVRLWSFKELHEVKKVKWVWEGLFAADLALLGALGSVLPALEQLTLGEPAAGPDGVQRLAEGLGAGALPAVTKLKLAYMHVGDAGASALAAALGRGALPRLRSLVLGTSSIGNAGLAALAPALRRLPALEHLCLGNNPFGDEGLAALVATWWPPGAPPAGGLTKLELLNVGRTHVTDTGCAALAAALDSGALPALETLNLTGNPSSVAANFAVRRAGLSWCGPGFELLL